MRGDMRINKIYKMDIKYVSELDWRGCGSMVDKQNELIVH